MTEVQGPAETALFSALLGPLRQAHRVVRARILACTTQMASAELTGVAAETEADTIYRIDRMSEDALLAVLEPIAREVPFVLVAEGLEEGALPLPRGIDETKCAVRVLMDPIDGTRPFMYDKRSAWILTGVAPNRGAETSLADIVLAIQTELPTTKQVLCDQLWAIRGQGARAVREDLRAQTVRPLTLRPSTATTLAHGYAQLTRLFPGTREFSARLDDELVRRVCGPPTFGKAPCFEDQYASTGGQLYELMAGHDRFCADLRPVLARHLGFVAQETLCCHPYDICTALIAEELGVRICGPDGRPVQAPFDLTTEIAWIGYANPELERLIAPLLTQLLAEHGLF